MRRSDTGEPGLTRRGRGRGFEYFGPDGEKVSDPEIVGRIAELVIPPAWQDVWICPYPGGHIQATGIDQRGRKQYVYHPRWRERRDLEKFDDMIAFARALPILRAGVDEHLARGDLSRDHVLGCAARLLDKGFFRIGSEDYAVTNDSYGLATILKEHVTLPDEKTIVFDYPAKSGKRRLQSVVDPEVADAICTLKRRRSGGEELLAYKRSGRWVDVRSEDINAYLREVSGHDMTAKDFRTWGATVMAAVALAVTQPAALTSKHARKRAVVRVVKEVAHYLGNTPAVARASYIDPRVFDRFADGESIAHALRDLPASSSKVDADRDATAIQGPAEAAVLELLED